MMGDRVCRNDSKDGSKEPGKDAAKGSQEPEGKAPKDVPTPVAIFWWGAHGVLFAEPPPFGVALGEVNGAPRP